MKTKLYVEDLKGLKITKVKPWSIYFEYNKQSYILHESSEEYTTSVVLYKRTLDNEGRYSLEYMNSNIGSLDIVKYISNYGSSGAYKHIRKDRFVKQLLSDGFSSGLYEREYNDMLLQKGVLYKAIKAINREISEIENKFWE